MVMKRYNVFEKGNKHTAEEIEAETEKDARKAYRVKNQLDIKLSKIDARVILSRVTKERSDEIYDKRTRKLGWTE